MDENVLEKYKEAGRIFCEVKEGILQKLKPGMKLLEIAEFVEKSIREKGGELAFPLNTSLNEIAAHYVAQGEDEKVVGEGDLLKLDMGVRVEGYIADGAFTYCSEKSDLIKAAEKAVEEAVKVIRPGVTVGEISEAIEGTVKREGLGLIVNLTGHGLEQHQFHAPPTIPNTATGSRVGLEEGQVVALEPFLTETNGQVKESTPVEIFRFLQERPVRSPEGRRILQFIKEQYTTFPFAKRWLYGKFSPVRVSLALRQLEQVGALESYPPLKEGRGQKVAQHEHTIIVSNPPLVITKV